MLGLIRRDQHTAMQAAIHEARTGLFGVDPALPFFLGMTVFYVWDSGATRGEVRPAVVVKPLGANGRANLVVFCDGENDLPQQDHNAARWKRNVPHDPGHAPGTWHYPTE